MDNNLLRNSFQIENLASELDVLMPLNDVQIKYQHGKILQCTLPVAGEGGAQGGADN